MERISGRRWLNTVLYVRGFEWNAFRDGKRPGTLAVVII
jgi:hypothetical protein